jgi:hypothetical protein
VTIISKLQIGGYCKKVSKKDLYRYPETPAMAYRLFRAGVLEWEDYPDLKREWDDQLRAVKIARAYYAKL